MAERFPEQRDRFGCIDGAHDALRRHGSLRVVEAEFQGEGHSEQFRLVPYVLSGDYPAHPELPRHPEDRFVRYVLGNDYSQSDQPMGNFHVYELFQGNSDGIYRGGEAGWSVRLQDFVSHHDANVEVDYCGYLLVPAHGALDRIAVGYDRCTQ